MISHTTKPDSSQPTADGCNHFDNWFDPIETRRVLGRMTSLKS